jgi:uncharacterized protein (DUF3084 family)
MIQLDVADFTEPAEVEPTTVEESSPEEPKAEVEAKEEASEAEPEEATEAKEESDTEAKVEEDAEQPKKGAEERKVQLQSEIRSLVSQRNTLRQEVEAKNAEQYRPQTAAEIAELGVEPVLAEVRALQQRTEMAEFNAHVAETNANLNTESLQLMADYPVFDSQSSEYNEGLSQRVNSLYQKVAGITTDPKTGLITNVQTLPYDFYKSFAETHTAGAQNGAVKGQVAAEKMLAAADTPSSSAPKQPKEDPFLAGLTRKMR